MAHVTLASMFWHRVETDGDRPAQQWKEGGAWRTRPWREVGEIVRELATGLLALGRRKDEAVGILSASRAEWVQADFAVFSAGCRTIPIYPSYPPDLIQYIVNDAEVKTLFVEDPAQLAKVLEVQREDGRARADRGDAGLRGRALGPGHDLGRRCAASAGTTSSGSAASWRAGWPRCGPDDIATIVYTSGTTGPPKGVVQTHGNHLGTLASAAKMSGIQDGDIHLLFLPLAHSFARLESFIGVHRGLTTAFAESIDKLRENLPEVKPHFICSVPRVFEKVYAGVLAKAEAGSPVKRKIFNWAVGVGREVSKLQQARRPVPAVLGFKHRIAHALVFAQAARGPRRASALRGLGRRPAVQGDRRVLPRGGHPHPGRLRPHRDLSLAHVQPDGALQVRLGRPGPAGHRGQDRARRRDPGARAQHRQGLLQEAGGDRGGLPGRRLVRHRGHRPDRRGRLPLHHRPQEGPHRHRGRDEHRAPEHREPAQGRSVHQPGDGATGTSGPTRWRSSP